MNNSSLDVCSTLRVDWGFVFLTLCICVISFLSVIGNGLVIFVLTRSRSLPSNVSLLLKNAAFALCYLALYVFGKCIYKIYACLFGFIPISRFVCGVVESPCAAGLFIFSLSIFAIGIDRLINAMSKNKQIDTDRPSRFAYCMVTLIWLFSITVVCGTTVFSYFDPDQQRIICYCNTFLSSPLLFCFGACPFFITTELITLTCYLIVYKHCRSAYLDFTINTTQHSLTQRYQMISNIKTTVTLMPTIIVHGITYLILGAALAYLGLIVLEDQQESIFAIDYILMATLIACVEGFFHPIFLFARHEHLLRTGAKYSRILKYFLDRKMRSQSRGVDPVHSVQSESVSAISKRNKLSSLPTSVNAITRVVNYHLRPEEHEDILSSIWATKTDKMAKA